MPDLAPDTPAVIGRMIIELHDNGTSMPSPHITFEPVGRFTPGLMQHFVPLFAQEINRAHAAVRAADRVAEARTATRSKRTAQ